MPIFKEFSADKVKTSKSSLNQIIDVIQEDISGSTTRRTYQVFVSGGVGPGVTSSLFQTVYDQDFTLQTANPVFDLTIGLYTSGTTVTEAQSGIDTNGKLLFPSSSLMMREKIGNYEQAAQVLLGSKSSQFAAPFGSTTAADLVDEAIFIGFKRLFSRDRIKRETFALKMYQSASNADEGGVPNLHTTTESGSVIFTDVGSATNKEMSFAGEVGNLVNSADTSVNVGNIFYDHGIVVLDAAKVISGSQYVSGVIDALNANTVDGVAGGLTSLGGDESENPYAKFIPDFFVSASIDDICDHLAATRFSSGTLTSMMFQNVTNINSSLYFCNVTADEGNYSSNPTYIDGDNRIVVIDEGQEDSQQSFTFITSIALMDADNNVLAVAKLSRPVENNPEKDLTFKVRLDY